MIELDDVAKPDPTDDEVLVRVHASSINRSDYYAFGGAAVLMRPMIGGVLRPKEQRLGGDFAGIVEAVGKNVTDVQPGDEVYGARTGAFADYVSAKTAVARKPANLSFEESAAVPVAAMTALQALRDHGRLQTGQRVLVNGGSGGVGTFAVQLAKSLGAGHVTAVCSTRNVERVRSLGADRVVDYTREDYTQSGERFDLIVDVAGSHSWRENTRVLVPDGTLVLAGAPTGNRLTGRMGRLARLWLASRIGSRRLVFFICKPNRADLAVLRELIEAGPVRPAVDRVYTLAEITDALEARARATCKASSSSASTECGWGGSAPPALPPLRHVVANDGRSPLAAEAAPARPEHHRQQRADRADDEQDPTDRVHVEARRRDMHGEREHGTDRDQDQAYSDSHLRQLLRWCTPQKRSNGRSGYGLAPAVRAVARPTTSA